MSQQAYPFEPLRFVRHEPHEMQARAEQFFREMDRRRSVRAFSRDSVPRSLIELAIRTASAAPSGAHQQPWVFVVVSDPRLKARIRAAAEEEEHQNYNGRMPREWLDAVAPLGTDLHKPHITDAPYVVVLFKQAYGTGPAGERHTHYSAIRIIT